MATHDDAVLLVQLLQWSSQSGMDDAHAAIFSDDFDPESATVGNADVRKVLNFGEAVGTLVKQGLLDRGLVLDMWAVTMSWQRVAPAALRLRQRTGEARLYENYEALARQAVPAAV